MLNSEDQVNRITYEAFSKFSNALIRCRSFEEVGECLKLNLKYLFNFHVLRASYTRGSQHVHITVKANHAAICLIGKPDLLAYEKTLLAKGIPLYWKAGELPALPAVFDLPAQEQAELWGWLFKSDGRQIVVSLLAGNSKPFTRREVTFVKLVAETLESKLLELCLYRELDEKNAMILSINQHQQEIITSRTREIADKNKKLLDISILNAHDVREPLSRIMGLLSLVDHVKSPDYLKAEILPRLKTSSSDLDAALKDVIAQATNDLLDLKA
ncbi:hypothetical protein [Pontibacter arcticus]|uniref:Signal transduction histidine kinase dimerisation/phosphoacceptor domain-containing protein n=1 Tax=Pontibacter arcticus TaxID=2080288 RepID=A0A364RFF3_9BACT|nr:hypothetical protein [Pontibacter arcticus]RAU82886.1 hypothetical protein DP923_06460 [Pontibacter arcticus]